MATLITKNSSTASSVPTNAQLVQGELAVNVTDKRLYTENASGTVVELGTNPGSAVTHTAGTAGAPAITTTGDTNTGIFFPAADTVAASTGGTERLRLDSSGNLGIGTSSPSSRLHLYSALGTAQITQDAGTAFRVISNNGLNYIQSGTALSSDSKAPLVFTSMFGVTEWMRLDSSGNLGLGVTPSAWISSGKAIDIGGFGSVAQTSSGSLASTFNAYQNSAGNWIYKTTNAAAQYQCGLAGLGQHAWFVAPSGTAGNAISFTQAMTLDASGNLGINSTSPSTFGKVTVQVAGTTTPTNLTNVGPSSINLYAAANGGSTDSTMGIFGWNSTTGLGSGIGFSRENSGDWGTQIRFYTHPTSTTNIGDITERARITSGGDFLINTTTSSGLLTVARGASGVGVGVTHSGDAGASAAIRVSYTASSGTAYQFDSFFNGSRVGYISSTSTATAYNTSSDYRLKENIQPMTGALAKVAALKPCTYNWKADGSEGEGFIAHELAEVVPQCVTGEKDAVDAEGNPVYQGIDTSFLVATLTAAIQELKAEFDAYKATHP